MNSFNCRPEVKSCYEPRTVYGDGLKKALRQGPCSPRGAVVPAGQDWRQPGGYLQWSSGCESKFQAHHLCDLDTFLFIYFFIYSVK